MRWLAVSSGVSLLVALVTLAMVARVDGRVMLPNHLVTLHQEDKMTTITSSWASSGTTHTVTTTKGNTETEAASLERHRAAVEAALLIYPKD